MSLRAYQKAAAQAENPRQAEYRLFGEVTRALIEASKADATDIKTRINALDWNRRMWSVLATDCAQPQNALPDAVRAQIISLSLWVSRHSSDVMRGKEKFEPLIEVNRAVMQGLGGPAEAA
jgi:flagellar protein FlaF